MRMFCTDVTCINATRKSRLRGRLDQPRQLLLAMALLLYSALASAGWPLADQDGRELPSLAPLLQEVNPAVVNISTYATHTVRQNPLLQDPFFRRFFNLPPNMQPEQKRRTQSAGSGVIIDAKAGTVVTNHHVVDGADEVRVSLEDGRSYRAEVLGSDPEVDIAVLKIDVGGDKLSDLKIANSDQLKVGDFVIAIGNPFGLGQTVTTGVVSALGRTGLGIEGYENFIQTDASINPGNSGGALVNLRGELVGINTAILAPSGGNVGIGFAIPTNMAQHSISQILEHGEVRRGQLGIIIQDLTPKLAEAFDIDKDQRGVLIAEVQKGSAAEKAGLQAGDVVVEVAGKAVHNAAQLRNAVGVRRVGETLKLKILRDGDFKQIKAKVGEAAKMVAGKDEPVHRFLEGATLENASDAAGVEIAAVEPGSAAAQAGLRPGDTIVSANRKRVRNIADLKQATAGSDKRLLLRVTRGQISLYIVLE